MRRSRGLTIVELLVIVCVIGIIAAIIVPWLMCYLDRARVARLTGDVKQAGIMVEQYIIEHSVPPKVLSDAYNGTNTVMPSDLLYCSGYWSDFNRGHGNDCDFYDEDNPGNSNPGERTGTAGLKYIIRTPVDLSPKCAGVDFIWCKGDPIPSVVKTGEWKGKPPGRFGKGKESKS